MEGLVGGNLSSSGLILQSRVYNFRTNRRHENARNILQDYNGVLHSDKYGAYEALAAKKQLTWCPCMVHARRKFLQVEYGDLAFCQWVLNRMQELFIIEQDAWVLLPAERLQMRQELSVPILLWLKSLLEELYSTPIC